MIPVPMTDPAAASHLRDAMVRWVSSPKVAIHIGPLDWEAAAGWGDTPFARGLQKAFGAAAGRPRSMYSPSVTARRRDARTSPSTCSARAPAGALTASSRCCG